MAILAYYCAVDGNWMNHERDMVGQRLGMGIASQRIPSYIFLILEGKAANTAFNRCVTESAVNRNEMLALVVTKPPLTDGSQAVVIEIT